MKKAAPVDEAAATVTAGAVVMIGGCLGVGSPYRIIDALIRQRRGATDAHLNVDAALRHA